MHTWLVAGLGDTDAALRQLGMLMGLAAVAALWWSGRRLRLDAPLRRVAPLRDEPDENHLG